MRKTISEEYQALNVEHHNSRVWGVAGGKWVNLISEILKQNDARTVLDYGAGRGVLSEGLRGKGYLVTEYDPGVIGKALKPVDGIVFDYIVSTDVFEHIEREFVENALDEIRDYMKVGGVFVICLGIAKKHWLKDGRNAHVLVRPREWWRKQLLKRFPVVKELPGRNWKSREMVVHVKKLK